MHPLTLSLALLLLLAAPIGAQEDAETIVPVHREPRHRMVFESKTTPTRILHLQVPPGVTTLFHRHDAPVLYVNFSGAQIRTQSYGKEWSRPPQPPPAAAAAPAPPATPPVLGPDGRPRIRVNSTTSYAQTIETHRLENTGTTGTLHAIVVVNQAPGNEAIDSKAAGFDATAELTNRWFRVYRFALAPGQASGPHRHTMPVVVVQTTAGSAEARGAQTTRLAEPSAWAHFDIGETHELRNTGSAGTEFVEVEVRQALP